MREKLFRIFFLGLSMLVLPGVGAQEASPVRVAAFYNVENLFDPLNDPASEDGDFTPEGVYRWTETRFREKTERIARVLAEISADVVGLAEVENHTVLDSLVSCASLRELNYDYVHFDSPDPRGIDVALLYRRGRFSPEGMGAVRYGRLPHYRTREMLYVTGRWKGLPVHLLVCHLPSAVSSGRVRREAAESVRLYADSLLRADTGRLLLVMGDFNANPDAGGMRRLVSGTGLENPFMALYKKGYGTYYYRGRWNMYDSVLVGGGVPGEVVPGVFVRDYLIQADGPYRGYPYRSFSGTEYIGGYSDHLPVTATFR